MKQCKIYSFLLLLLFLPSCFFTGSTRQFDCARSTYENILYKYQRETELFNKIEQEHNADEKRRLELELKDEILLKSEEFKDTRKGWFKKDEFENYPFMQYKRSLDKSINELESARQNLYWKNDGLGKSVQDLVTELDALRRHIVLHPEYSRERRMVERKKIIEAEMKLQKKKAKHKTA